MRKHLIILVLCVFAVGAKAATTTITINSINRLQTIEGWGASLCWWAAQAGQWDNETIEQIADWLVSPDGLNYNVFRYNIPGGDDPSNANCTQHHMQSGKGLRAEMAGFAETEADFRNKTYKWENDKAQIKMLRAIVARAEQYGKKDILMIEAFANTPPYWMTVSGCASGAATATDTNLKSDYYDAFAEYLIDVCQHFKDAEGIEFYTLEPFNEPNSNYWGQNGGQEGCGFNPADQVNFVKKLYPKLAASGLKTVISVSDETNLEKGISTWKTYSSDSNVMGCFPQWNVHTYDGTDDQRKELRDMVNNAGKRLWMSETGPSGNSTGLTSNLNLAQKMFNDLRLLQPVVWCDWQAMEANKQWCLLTSGGDNNGYRTPVNPNKNYYVRSQVTRYIKAGYTIIESGNANVLAAINPNQDEIVVCLLNTSTSRTATYKLDVSSKSGITVKQATITDSSRDCAYYEISNLSNFQVPKQSIVTIVLDGDFSLMMTDSDGQNLVFGDKYMMSTTQTVDKGWWQYEYPDFYFYASDDVSTVSSQKGFPQVNAAGFYDPQYIWELALAGPCRVTLQNMRQGKYLAGGVSDTTPDLSATKVEDAMTFLPSGPNIKHDKTPNYWVLEAETGSQNKYLNWRFNTAGNGFCYWTVGSSNDYSNFRFHKMEYVHIDVYEQKNGFLIPMDFCLNGNTTITYDGSADLYHTSISGKVTSIGMASPFDCTEKKYILNGEQQGATFDVKALKNRDHLTMIFVNGATSQTDEFYKIKKNDKFITAGESLSLNDDSDDAIFYHSASNSGSTLLSYTKGLYVKDNELSTIEDNSGSQILFVKCGDNDEEDEIKLSAIMADYKYLNCDYNGNLSVSSKTYDNYSLVPVKTLPVGLRGVDAYSSRYGTFFAPVDVTVPEGLEAYVVESITTGEDEDVLTLSEVDVIPAGKGVILYEENPTENKYSVKIDGASSAKSILTGTYACRKVGEKDVYYGLNAKNGVVGFYQMRPGSAVLSPFRAFLDYTGKPMSKGFAFSFSETDAIEAIEMWHSDNAIYDLQGRRVQNPGTGLYIVNGKKILIRK